MNKYTETVLNLPPAEWRKALYALTPADKREITDDLNQLASKVRKIMTSTAKSIQRHEQPGNGVRRHVSSHDYKPRGNWRTLNAIRALGRCRFKMRCELTATRPYYPPSHEFNPSIRRHERPRSRRRY